MSVLKDATTRRFSLVSWARKENRVLSIFSMGKKVGEIECNSYITPHFLFCLFLFFPFVLLLLFCFFFLFHSPSGEKYRISEIVV